MKSHLIIVVLLACSLFFTHANATDSYKFKQTVIDTIVTYTDDEFLLDAKAINLSNTTVTMVYRLTSKSVPAGWIFTLCDSQKCNVPGVKSESGESILSITGKSQYFKVGVTPTTLLGVLELEYETYDAANPTAKQNVKFKFSTLPDQVARFSQNSITVSGVAGTSQFVNITSNSTWTISGVPTWISSSLSNGTNSALVKFTVSETNPNTTNRMAVVSITGPTTTTTLSITQNSANTTSLLKSNSHNLISVFPNPVSTNGTLNFNAICDVELVDLSGNSVFLKKNTNNLSVNGIIKGLYFLKINNLHSIKIIVD